MQASGKKVLIAMAIVAGGVVAPQLLWAIDQDTLTEIRRIDQRVSGFNDNIQRLLSDVRSLQRENEKLRRELEKTQTAAKEATDTMIRMQNTDIANLIAVDKQLAQRLNDMSQHMQTQTSTWNWGSQDRSCEDVGKHQQIQSVRSADGQFSLRYLCYDGRAIHLGTEVNLPPQ